MVSISSSENRFLTNFCFLPSPSSHLSPLPPASSDVSRRLLSLPFRLSFLAPDQLRNSYQVGYDSSLRVIYANGMDTHYQTEPHILAGAANPTVARRNMTLPGENGQNLVEWRFRKEQTRGKVIVFGRKLRVRVKRQNGPE